jgi:DNA-binding NtrC family response regulator
VNPANKSNVQSGSRTILLVDDDLALGAVIKEYLTEEELDVIYVQDSMAALGVLETGPKIDLLLTDIAMPQGTPNGVSLALMARRMVPGIETLFITGRPDLLQAVGELPGKAFLKPVNLAELLREIGCRSTDRR